MLLRGGIYLLLSLSSSSLRHFKDESSLKMNAVDHIPQTLASHSHLPDKVQPQDLEGGGSAAHHGADMLKPDPRDTFFNSKSLLIFSFLLLSLLLYGACD